MKLNVILAFFVLIIPFFQAEARSVSCKGYGYPAGYDGAPIQFQGSFDLIPGGTSGRGHDAGSGSFALSPGYSVLLIVTVGQGHRGGEWLLYRAVLLNGDLAVASTSGESPSSNPGTITIKHLDNVEVYNWEKTHKNEPLPKGMMIDVPEIECTAPVSS